MPPPNPPGPHPLATRFVAWTLAHGRILSLLSAILFLVGGWRTARLYASMNSDVEELLPRNSTSVVAVDELRARLEGARYLGVVVDAGDPSRLPGAEQFLDDLATRIRAYPPGLVHAVRTGDGDERRFVEKHAPFYIDLDDLEAVHARVVARRDWEVTHKLGTALDDDDSAPPLDFSDLRKKYEGGESGRPRHPNDRFTDERLHASFLLVQVNARSFDESKAVFLRVKDDVASLDPGRYAPGMRVGYAGDVAISVEETEALLADLSVSSFIVGFLVLASLVLYYRWWRSIAILLPPLLLAASLSFALASLPPFGVTQLNANTAFLGSIIVGNGINFGIILLARYAEERRKGVDVQPALAIAVDRSRTGTLAAALAASASYASLAVTQFRGFRQFGIIGGIGMVLAWILAYLLMPPLVAWVDRGPETAPPPKRDATSLVAWVARLVARAPVALAVLGIVVTIVAAARVRTIGIGQLETDLTKLRSAKSAVSGACYWSRYVDSILGEYLSPIVLLADDPETARTLAVRAREASVQPPLSEFVASVRSIDDVLPAKQAEKQKEIEAIRADITPKMRSLLTDEQRKDYDRFLGDRVIERPVSANEVPSTFTTGMMERDGTIGRTVLIYPRFSEDMWRGAPLARFILGLRSLTAQVGRETGRPSPRVAGGLPVSADLISSVAHDGPIASLVALVLVFAVVLIVFRGDTTTWWVVGSLVAGVAWLAAGMMLAHVKINFANFIAFPITFGIGVDYAVNVMSRYAQGGRRDVLDAVRSVGSAVALCSFTTIVGYSSLLFAGSRALYLFGAVAVMGELACLTTAIICLPAVLLTVGRLRDRLSRRSRQAAQAPPVEEARMGSEGAPPD